MDENKPLLAILISSSVHRSRSVIKTTRKLFRLENQQDQILVGTQNANLPTISLESNRISRLLSYSLEVETYDSQIRTPGCRKGRAVAAVFGDSENTFEKGAA